MSAACVPGTRCFLRQLFPGPPAAMQRRFSLDVSAPLLRTRGYVDGRWMSAASEFPVLDPATGEEIARVSDCGPAEAKQAVDAASKAFHSWKQRTAKVSAPERCEPYCPGKNVNEILMSHIRLKNSPNIVSADVFRSAGKRTLIRRLLIHQKQIEVRF